jgi:hypothetical protein
VPTELPYKIIEADDPILGKDVLIGSKHFNALVIAEILGSTPGVPPVFAISPTRGPLTDYSGTIAAANVSQIAVPANANRKYLFIQNNSGPGNDIWINFGAPATQSQPSILLPNKAAFVMECSFVSTQVVNVIGANVGDAYTAKEG